MCQLYFDKTDRKKRKTEKISTKWWNMSFQPPSPPLPWKNCLWQPMWLKVTLENPGVQWKGSDIFRAKNLGINTLKKVTRTILLCLHHPSLKLYSRASRETLSALNSSHRESENLGSSWIPQLCGTQPERFIFLISVHSDHLGDQHAWSLGQLGLGKMCRAHRNQTHSNKIWSFS